MGALDERVAVVTGGSRGIGRAIVRRLAADGASVLFSYHQRADLAAELVADLRAAGGRADAVRADLSDLDDVRGLFDEAERSFGGVDVLVANAGAGADVPVVDTTEEFYDRLMAVNAKSAFFAIQQAARRMRDSGSVVTVSSVATALPAPGGAVYAATKAAVEQFTRVAACELAERGIRVNAVSPGPTDTDLLRRGNPPEELRAAVAMTPLARLGRPADIAGVVAFLAGPDAAWITGQNIRATGGMA
ncbi:glucose 1-dehydrogenase [Saccharopolyspora rosea]|uniref:Glucose 1-dehydrogenase n=1 Tax=Saccharopolyspora rosea TaxID=524884 RepID=A0ABW3FXY9_9PSEU|nr:glucose 1-dehydrogenase [Saccharopolyspora rosea]